MMKDIERENKLINLRDRADQIASTVGAVSDAATYSPNDITNYKDALVLLSSLARELADGLNEVVIG